MGVEGEVLCFRTLEASDPKAASPCSQAVLLHCRGFWYSPQQPTPLLGCRTLALDPGP